MGRRIYGVDTCSCGAPRLVDLDEPNLIQCDNCRHDEKIDQSEMTGCERERLEKRELLTARQLLDRLPLCPWSEEYVYRLAAARQIPSVKIADNVFFDARLAEWALQPAEKVFRAK